MANVTIRNLPDTTYAELKRRAEANRRSLNQELILCLEAAANNRHGQDPRATLEDVRRFRASQAHRPLTEREIDAAKRHGRP
jgi:plasmid stability protein